MVCAAVGADRTTFRTTFYLVFTDRMGSRRYVYIYNDETVPFLYWYAYAFPELYVEFEQIAPLDQSGMRGRHLSVGEPSRRVVDNAPAGNDLYDYAAGGSYPIDEPEEEVNVVSSPDVGANVDVEAFTGGNVDSFDEREAESTDEVMSECSGPTDDESYAPPTSESDDMTKPRLLISLCIVKLVRSLSLTTFKSPCGTGTSEIWGLGLILRIRPRLSMR